MRLYLDNCCFNRPYDVQNQIRVRLETEAKIFIQDTIIKKKNSLIWSYILDFENSRNPFTDRKIEISSWRIVAESIVLASEELLVTAEHLQEFNLKSKDALHIASAIIAGCDYFLTTDDKIINKNTLISQIKITSPIGFIEQTGGIYD